MINLMMHQMKNNKILEKGFIKKLYQKDPKYQVVRNKEQQLIELFEEMLTYYYQMKLQVLQMLNLKKLYNK